MRGEPSLEDIAGQLRGLVSGRLSRERASAWAAPWLDGPDPKFDDDATWLALVRLGAATTEGVDSPFLYTDEDYREWLGEAEDVIASRC
jgi:hypothetical protein